MNQLPKVSLSLRMLGTREDSHVIIQNVFIDIGNQDVLSGYYRRTLEVFLLEEGDQRVEGLVPLLEIQRRLDHEFEVDIMDGNLRDSTFRVKLNSVRSLGPSQYVLVFSSAPPDPKRQPFFVRWFGALIPTKWWKNPQPVPNRLFPTVNQSQMSS